MTNEGLDRKSIASIASMQSGTLPMLPPLLPNNKHYIEVTPIRRAQTLLETGEFAQLKLGLKTDSDKFTLVRKVGSRSLPHYHAR